MTTKVQGVVLHALPFKERDQIVTLFTPDGLLKLFVRKKASALTALLTVGEFIFLPGKKDLHRFRDGSIVNQNLKLRDRLENLEAAGEMVQIILKSQFIGKASSELYVLFCYLLEMIPQVAKPKDLVALFMIKTLKAEGILQLADRCSVCNKKPFFRFGGERFCQNHNPYGAIELSENEEMEIWMLSEGRNLKEILNESLTVHQQVSDLFEHSFN